MLKKTKQVSRDVVLIDHGQRPIIARVGRTSLYIIYKQYLIHVVYIYWFLVELSRGPERRQINTKIHM